jgi:hypothetical protein
MSYFLELKLKMTPEDGLGRDGLHLGEERKRAGPETAQDREGFFFSEVFSNSFLFKSILLFWEQFENSKFSEIFQSNHGPSLHIEAP